MSGREGLRRSCRNIQKTTITRQDSGVVSETTEETSVSERVVNSSVGISGVSANSGEERLEQVEEQVALVENSVEEQVALIEDSVEERVALVEDSVEERVALVEENSVAGERMSGSESESHRVRSEVTSGERHSERRAESRSHSRVSGRRESGHVSRRHGSRHDSRHDSRRDSRRESRHDSRHESRHDSGHDSSRREVEVESSSGSSSDSETEDETSDSVGLDILKALRRVVIRERKGGSSDLDAGRLIGGMACYKDGGDIANSAEGSVAPAEETVDDSSELGFGPDEDNDDTVDFDLDSEEDAI